MITLKDISSNRRIGSISYAQLQFLDDEVAKEHRNDQDYRVSRATLNILKERGADASLTTIIEKAMGDQELIEFYWIKS